MSQPRPVVSLAPVTANSDLRNPKILLGGKHQPTLLRWLDGWPRRKGRASAFLIQFVEERDELARFASDSFDLAVIQSPCAEDAEVVIRNLIRVSRQGLIALR
ncbi:MULTISPECIES: class I SAM-dependent methyltransferase [unclassified Pseudomonas]|uniref:class I SAM-dependent methyltransferase n=1 Tax=unclassified Pseudomonas TaxID=196821 RepID=UPI0028D50FC3|nr:class I SAM-dependent methyltransferase [uncultured Pseudomonas sp.]